MLAIIYLLLCFSVGWAICSFCFPRLDKITLTTYDNKAIKLSPYLLLVPVWFIIGLLTMTWSVYLIALVSSNLESPLVLANGIILPLAFSFFLYTYYKKIIKNKEQSRSILDMDSKTRVREMIIFAFVALLASILMWSTFYVRDGQLNIGVSVFSDFSPHIGMIRSFSYGNNFPSSYSHFAGEDIKYHFMFQFLVGNLEFLGMRIDYAFNIPSILSFISAFMLLYVLTLKITGRVLSGVLALLFFAFRSGKALFIYLSRIPKGNSIIKTLWDNTNFIGDTPHEDWGLWNLNVYCNQRHLAFGLATMFFVIIMFLPHLYEMFEALRLSNKASNVIKKNKYKKGIASSKWIKLGLIFFNKEGWEIKCIRHSIALGILLGSLSFFHGAAVIGCLLVLFVIAVFAKRRLEFLITTVITVFLSMLQTGYFIEGSAVSPEVLFGFIAENKTIFGLASYLDQLLGILIPVIVIAFIFGKLIERYLILAFIAPLVFAFTISLTVDVTVNHKYIMMSCILLGILAASLITRMIDNKELIMKIAGIILILMMTSTGIYDFTTVLRKNSREGKIILDMDDPLTDFIREHSDSKDVFLTDSYGINQVVFGGAMLYQGHQYYAWSAGYDTNYRDKMVRLMYEAASPTELDKLVKDNNISFIIIDYGNRTSMEYHLNEDNIRETYECVYETGYEEWNISIFDTSKRIKQ
ncbi:MAG: hypothetical protein EWM47_00230 [Anaerolineaceae bacterium]|nr:MAG: hypothetical protein EWM47_00230 [Anaerolineaceae bacterium]